MLRRWVEEGFLAHIRSLRDHGIDIYFSIGVAITEPILEAIRWATGGSRRSTRTTNCATGHHQRRRSPTGSTALINSWRKTLHPQRADVLTVLDGVLAERADLREAELSVQCHRRVIGHGYAREDHVNRLVGKAIEQRAIQQGTHTLASATDIQRDTYLDRLPEGFVVAVTLSAGVAQDQVAASSNKQPVRPGRGELFKPISPLGHAGRPSGERSYRVRPRVVEDLHDPGEVILGRRPNLDRVQVAR
jgi:hypothetical protein